MNITSNDLSLCIRCGCEHERLFCMFIHLALPVPVVIDSQLLFCPILLLLSLLSPSSSSSFHIRMVEELDRWFD